MIRFTYYGGASVTIPYVPQTVQPPMVEAVLTLEAPIPNGTVLFAAFGSQPPDKRDAATWFVDGSTHWFVPDTPQNPMWDSKGNAWLRDMISPPIGPFARRLWRAVVTTQLEIGDQVSATFFGATASGLTAEQLALLGDVEGIYPSFGASGAFELFGFSCLGSFVVLDQALSGYGQELGVTGGFAGETIDTTPLGGAPYAPRLQLAEYIAGIGLKEDPDQGFDGYAGLHSTPATELPDPPFAIPDGWTHAATVVDTKLETMNFHPGIFNTPEHELAVFQAQLGSVNYSFQGAWYYRFVPPGAVEDEIVLGPSSGGDYLTAVSVATYQVREIPCPAAGVDLLQTQTLHLFRSGAADADVQAERSGTAGASWEAPVIVSSDAGPSTTPTLTRNAQDHLWCWYHDAGGDTQGYLSRDLGASWEAFATHAGLHFPRAVRQLTRALLCAHDGTHLRVYQSANDGATLAEITALVLECPEQLAAFAVDRRDVPHLVITTEEGVLEHRRLLLDDTWSDPVEVAASGTHPALALGIERGLLLYWDEGELQAVTTDETFGATADTVTAPAGFAPGYLGALVNHQNTLHYVAGLDSESAPLLSYSADDAASWQSLP